MCKRTGKNLSQMCRDSSFSYENSKLLQWFAVRTKSNFEMLVANNLIVKGFETYLPLLSVQGKTSNRTTGKQAVAFSGYVFVRLDIRTRMPILTTPGVVDFVGFGKVPAPVPQAEIESVHTVLKSGLATGTCSYLAEGQSLRINAGPLKGVEGVLVKRKSNWRFIVSVTLLQRALFVEIDKETLSVL